MENTAHFKKESKIDQIVCPCCGKEEMVQELIYNLEELRTQIGSAIIVTSGWRCKKHNEEIFGAKASPHMDGVAVDIKCPSINVLELYTAVQKSGLFTRVGLNLFKSFVHVDIKPTYPPYNCKLWWYDSLGNYHCLEVA